MNRKEDALKKNYYETEVRHPSPLMEDLLDTLEHEQAYTWLLKRIDEDRNTDSHPLHVYKTSLFAIYVDYGVQTVFVSAELGCHPPDETFSLIDFYNTVKENTPPFEEEAGKSIKYGDNISVHVYKKKF